MAGNFYAFQQIEQRNFASKVILDEEIWKTIEKPHTLQAAEGENVTAVILVAGGNRQKLPEVKWVKVLLLAYYQD